MESHEGAQAGGRLEGARCAHLRTTRFRLLYRLRQIRPRLLRTAGRRGHPRPRRRAGALPDRMAHHAQASIARRSFQARPSRPSGRLLQPVALHNRPQLHDGDQCCHSDALHTRIRRHAGRSARHRAHGVEEMGGCRSCRHRCSGHARNGGIGTVQDGAYGERARSPELCRASPSTSSCSDRSWNGFTP